MNAAQVRVSADRQPRGPATISPWDAGLSAKKECMVMSGRLADKVALISVGGLSASPRRAGYGVTKSGLLALTRSLAYDYGRQRIRVDAVCPGWMRTPLGDQVMDAVASEKNIDREDAHRLVATNLPLGRVADPAEIANCCLFLASDEASFVTGAVLVAVGGGDLVDVGTPPLSDW